MKLTDVTAKIGLVVDWFIHPSLRLDRERVNQARIFLISHLFGPFLGGAVPIALFLLDPTPGFEVAVLAASIFGFWLFPFLLKRTGAYNLLSVLSVQNLIFAILWSCYWYGGIRSPTLPWVLTIPMLAFFYIGPSAWLRSVVIALFGANVFAFIGVSMVAPPGAHNIPAYDVEWLGIVSTIAVALYVTMMALFYAKVYESQFEIEAEMREHLQTSAELRKATEEAERAGAAKAEFLAKMSHELRTPLNAVINYSEMLLEDATSDGDQGEVNDLKKIHTAGRNLLQLINEVLDLSKIDAGMMGVYKEEADVRELVRQSVNEFRVMAAEHNDVIDIKIDDDFGTLFVDQQKIQQILWQVVDNAVKFTKNGLIGVHVFVRNDGQNDTLHIDVTDSGVGIAEHELPTLFELFTVLGDASSSKYGGTGLGLALSQKLCRLLGGDLKVESVLGQGSCFTITIPLAVEANAEGGAASAEVQIEDLSNVPGKLQSAA
jgi:signal transduction histidine kinase